MKKSISTAALVAALTFTLCGCQSGGQVESENSSPNSVAAPVIKIEDETGLKDQDIDSEESEIDTEDAETTPAEHEINIEDYFISEEISDEIFSRMQGKSFPDDCTMSRDDLRYLKLLYKDIEGADHEGEMVCNRLIADKLIAIFKQLYEVSYPIEKIALIDEYDGDDDLSMSDNNTSCFNFRFVSGTNSLSNHALGLAVDLNPRYNPYVRKKGDSTIIEPECGSQYADRSKDFPYKIDEEDLAYKLFTKAGFSWGGSWKNSKDYQHFEYVQ